LDDQDLHPSEQVEKLSRQKLARGLHEQDRKQLEVEAGERRSCPEPGIAEVQGLHVRERGEEFLGVVPYRILYTSG
jgi:hypothetical protein